MRQTILDWFLIIEDRYGSIDNFAEPHAAHAIRSQLQACRTCLANDAAEQTGYIDVRIKQIHDLLATWLADRNLSEAQEPVIAS
jgi:hypothetical protein